MAQIKKNSGSGAAKNHAADNADKEARTGIVAKAKRAFRVLPGNRAGLIQTDNGGCADGITAQKADRKGRKARSADAEAILHHPVHPICGAPWKNTDQNFGKHQKGKQRRNDCCAAQQQTGAHRMRGGIGKQKQRKHCKNHT